MTVADTHVAVLMLKQYIVQPRLGHSYGLAVKANFSSFISAPVTDVFSIPLSVPASHVRILLGMG